MSASSLDKITDTRNAARPNSARVSSGRSAGGTTLACDNLTGWPTASKVHFVTYQLDSTSTPVANTQLDCTGIVSGNTIGSFTVVDGTDTGNSVNDVVEMLPTAAWGQDLADALTSQHTRTGTHKSITNTGGLTTDTLTTSSTTSLAATIASSLTVSGATTLTGAVGGTGYNVKTIANSYKFSVYRNAAQNTGNNAFAVLQCDTKLFDTGSNVDIVTNKGRFTAPVAGFYQFSALAEASLSGAGAFGIALFKNGSRVLNGQFISSTAFASTTDSNINVGGILQLAANDYVEAQVFGSSAIALVVANNFSNYFQGFLVSAT